MLTHATEKNIDGRVLAVSRGQGGNLRADKESFPEKGTFKHQHPENGSRNNERMNAK